jgi:hypothetical protein
MKHMSQHETISKNKFYDHIHIGEYLFQKKNEENQINYLQGKSAFETDQ